MRSLFFLLSLSMTMLSKAQQWCPSGAEWQHRWMSFTEVGSVRVTYTGDEQLGGHTAQRLETMRTVTPNFGGSTVESAWNTYYTRSSADLVWLWNGTTYDTLYAFGMAPGTRWNAAGLEPSATVTVQDTGTMMVQGLPLRYSVVEYTPNYGVVGDTLIERIGSLRVFLDPSVTLIMDGPGVGLRCYADEHLSYRRGVEGECALFLGLDAHPGDGGIRLAPNPTADRCTVHLPAGLVANMHLVDATGRTVLQHKRLVDGTAIDLSGLAPGAYVALLTGADGTRVGVQRLVGE